MHGAVSPLPLSQRARNASPLAVLGSTPASARRATMKIRLRRCGTPKYRASRHRHPTPYPQATTSLRSRWKSSPLLEERRPGTFSSTSHRGLRYSATRRNSKARTDRSPLNPFRLPAMLKSWHGNPPIITSTGSGLSLQSVMPRSQTSS